jgi:hypothetical protein
MAHYSYITNVSLSSLSYQNVLFKRTDFLFLCDLFNETLNSSGYMAGNHMQVGEKCIGNLLEGNTLAFRILELKLNSVAFSPRANYTD